MRLNWTLLLLVKVVSYTTMNRSEWQKMDEKE